MTFASEVAKPNSERFALVKITPARYVGGDMASQGGGIYDIAWSYPINRVERNGTALTEVSSTPGTNDQWYYDGTTLEVKLAAAPSAANVIVVFYDLFYTTERFRITTTDPEDSATDEIHWEPRILSTPRVKQNVSDLINGVVSSSASTLEIANTDQAFQAYLGANDSFYRKTVKVWFCAGSVSSIQKVYEGRVQAIALRNDSVVLTVYDSFSLLDQPALFGEDASECYWRLEDWPNMYPPYDGRPIPLVLQTRTKNRFPDSIVDIENAWSRADSYSGTMLEATCTNFTADSTSTSNNRTWGLCRFNSDGARTLEFGTITAVDNTNNGSNLWLAGLKTTGYNLRVGDSVRVTDGAANTFYGYVLADNNTSYDFGGGADTYQVILKGGYSGTAPNLTTGSTYVENKAPAVFLVPRGDPDNVLRVFWDLDYTFTESTTGAGNKYVKIDFRSTVESRYSSYFSGAAGNGYIDPAYFQVFFLYGAGTDLNHADIVSALLTQAGVSVDSASISTAKSALSSDVSFTIPFWDETDFGSYRHYLERICRSTMGIVHFANDFEAEYTLLSTPSSSDSVSDDKFRGISVDIEYRDIVTQLVAYNGHEVSERSLTAANTPSETVTSAVAKHLHGIANTVRFVHVLQEISSRIQDIFDILSNRKAVYRFSTASRDLAAEIGDDLQLDADEVLGGSGSVDLKIIGLDKSPDGVDVEATDLLDI